MFRKFSIATFILLAFAGFAPVNSAAVHAAPSGTTIQDNAPEMEYGYWAVFPHPQASGGSLDQSSEAGSTARFRFKGTSILWVTRKGDYAGKAQVWIDGVNKGKFDLYAASEQNQAQYSFDNLTNAKHTLVIHVLGKKNPAATGRLVAVDAFLVGGVTTQEDSTKIKYDSWSGKTNPNASGGTFRISTTTHAIISLRAGIQTTSFSWVTAKGPSYGKATVMVDGQPRDVVDLYAPTQQWQVTKTYALDNYYHSITIEVMGEKNAASTGYGVVMDALEYQ